MKPPLVIVQRRHPRPREPRPAPEAADISPRVETGIAAIRAITSRLRNTPTTAPAEMAADRVLAANEIDRQLERMVGA